MIVFITDPLMGRLPAMTINECFCWGEGDQKGGRGTRIKLTVGNTQIQEYVLFMTTTRKSFFQLLSKICTSVMQQADQKVLFLTTVPKYFPY